MIFCLTPILLLCGCRPDYVAPEPPSSDLQRVQLLQVELAKSQEDRARLRAHIETLQDARRNQYVGIIILGVALAGSMAYSLNLRRPRTNTPQPGSDGALKSFPEVPPTKPAPQKPVSSVAHAVQSRAVSAPARPRVMIDATSVGRVGSGYSLGLPLDVAVHLKRHGIPFVCVFGAIVKQWLTRADKRDEVRILEILLSESGGEFVVAGGLANGEWDLNGCTVLTNDRQFKNSMRAKSGTLPPAFHCQEVYASADLVRVAILGQQPLQRLRLNEAVAALGLKVPALTPQPSKPKPNHVNGSRRELATQR